jgi:hypothetical protein
VRGEGEEGKMGEEKQSSHDPPYTNKHSTLPLNMSCHSCYAPSCILRLRLLEE